jgi:HAD superfamily hydrolase (TIGR01662 family)
MSDSHRPVGEVIPPALPLAFGLLRLCGEDRPSTESAIALIHRVLDQGIRFIDTADSYCIDNKDFHYGEMLANQAVTSWHGPHQEVQVLTKVGLVRPSGKWVPNGTPKHIRKSIDERLMLLQSDCIPWLQLHVRDPRVPFEETLGTLAELVGEGKVMRVGLCNVGPAEIRQAMRIFPVASIQCELSVTSRKSAQDGTLQYSKQLGIPFFAYRPLGGATKVSKLSGNRVLSPLAQRHRCTPQEIAVAAVVHAQENVIALFGATKQENIDSCIRGALLPLDVSDRTALSIKYSFDADPDAAAALAPMTPPADLQALQPGLGPNSSPEVVILMGIQGAGKSELVDSYVQHGYVRLNRDLQGGKLDDLVVSLRELLAQGQTRVVLDNTYPTRVSRAGVIRCAHAAGIPVRCRWLDTPMGEARINVVQRILDRYERLLGPTELKDFAKSDPNLPPPIAMQRWADTLERPEFDEGFSAIDIIPFARRHEPNHVQRAVLLDVDGTLRTTKSGEIYPRSADDVVLLPNRKETLSRYVDQGFSLFFLSNQSGIASGKLSDADARAAFDRTAALIGLPITEIVYCPHPAFPVGCFCRKPMPGMGVYLKRKYGLDLSSSIMVGDMDSDEAFADSISIPYMHADQFFA